MQVKYRLSTKATFYLFFLVMKFRVAVLVGLTGGL